MYFAVISHQGLRNEWVITRPACTIVERCDARMAYHEDRVAFWKKQLATAEETLKNQGIKLTHHAVTGGQRTEATLDPDMSNRVAECQHRMKANAAAIEKFRAFRALLLLMGAAAHVTLNADDVLYFNIEGADTPSEDE